MVWWVVGNGRMKGTGEEEGRAEEPGEEPRGEPSVESMTQRAPFPTLQRNCMRDSGVVLRGVYYGAQEMGGVFDRFGMVRPYPGHPVVFYTPTEHRREDADSGCSRHGVLQALTLRPARPIVQLQGYHRASARWCDPLPAMVCYRCRLLLQRTRSDNAVYVVSRLPYTCMRRGHPPRQV